MVNLPSSSNNFVDNRTRNRFIAVETQLAPGVPVPDAITAKLTFNGMTGTTYSYSMSGLATGQQMRVALQADGGLLKIRY